MSNKFMKVTIWICAMALVVVSLSGVKAFAESLSEAAVPTIAAPTTIITPTKPATTKPATTVKPIVVTAKPTKVSGEASADPAKVETTTAAPTTVAPTTEAPTTTAKAKAPAKAKIKKVSAKKKSTKKLSLTLSKVSGAKGYQIAVYKTKKNANKDKNAIVKKIVKKTSVTVISKKLKNQKTLFVKVRAYKLDGKKNVYGKWSAVKKVKIKK